MRLPAAASLTAALLASACFAPDGPHPLWSADPGALANPLPDGRLVEDGHLALRSEWFAPLLSDAASTFEAYELFGGYTEQLRDLDGYGTMGSAFVRFSERPDGDLDGALQLVSLDDMSLVDAQVRPHPTLPWAAIEPRLPLAAGSHYAVAVLAGPTAGGAPLVRSPDLWAAAPEHADRIDAVAAATGRAPDEVLLAQEFTTTDPAQEMRDAAARVADIVPPFSFDAPHADRPRGVLTRAEAVAAFPDDAQRLAAAGRVGIGLFHPVRARDEHGVLDVAGIDEGKTDDVEFVVVTPDPAVHPAPWPCVVAQHGFNGDNRFAIRVARELNEAGMLVIGMDAVSHGLRGSTIQFFNIEDVRVARDNFRQTGLDLTQLATLCAEGDLDLDGDGVKDTTGEVGYFGHSMGAIIGAVFAAVNPRVHSVVLNAPGGGITRIFESEGLKGGIQLLSLPALGLEWGDDAYDEVLPVLIGSTQPIFDPADPLSFAAGLGEQRVLVVEGKGDHLVPNTATDALIEAAGLDVPDGAAEDADGLHVAVRVDLDDFELTPAGDNVDIDAHNTHFALAGVRRITAEFLRSQGTVLLDVAAP